MRMSPQLLRDVFTFLDQREGAYISYMSHDLLLEMQEWKIPAGRAQPIRPMASDGG